MSNGRGQQSRGQQANGGGLVYGLGLIGALVWFWKQADGFGDHVLGVLQALVWPAYLVYDVFQHVHG
jgi:hypothetical protein